MPPPTTKQSRSAKRSSLACAGCKRAKRRCDISEQLHDAEGCTNCREKGDFCEVRYGEDKRRKRGVLSTTDLRLADRLRALEEFIAQSGDADNALRFNSTPSMRRASSVQSQTVNGGSPGPTQQFNFKEAQASVEVRRFEVLAKSSPNVEMCQTKASGAPSIEAHPYTPYGTANNGMGTSTLPPDASPGGASISVPSVTGLDEDSNAIIGKVIARASGLEAQDQDNREYFGTTSIYHLSERSQGEPEQLESPSSSLYQAKQPPIVHVPAELDTINEPEPIVSHLLDLFWKWQASHLQVFHRKLFLAEKELYDSEQPHKRHDFFSPSLLYAIMALASMVSLDRGVRWYSMSPGGVAGDKFAEKAQKLFDEEMCYPSITTVQTALLLGSRYGVLGKNSLGWTYSGIAMRMAVEIGLHVNCDKAVASRHISTEMAEVRKMVFWGCYVQDKLWSAYCGRPSMIMDWEITVATPRQPDPVTDSSPDAEAVLAAVHQQIVLLTIQCSRILTELYSQKHNGRSSDLRTVANAIHGDLFAWHCNLPQALTWPNENGTPTSPHVLLMHMQFYFTLLLLHRPFIDLNDAITTIGHIGETPQCATTICTLAATNLAKLTRDYSIFYSLKQLPSPAVHFIFTAATIHLINYQISQDEHYHYLFQGCLAGLAEIGRSYPISDKAVSILQELSLRLRPNVGPVKRSTPPGAQNNPLDAPLHHNHELSVAEESPNSTAQVAEHMVGPGTDASSHPYGAYPNGNNNNAPETNGLGPFDWSTYNSPIALPDSLNDFDLASFTFPADGALNSETNYAVPPNFGMPYDNLVGGLSHSINTGQDGMSYSMQPDSAIFDRFYGTAFGLN